MPLRFDTHPRKPCSGARRVSVMRPRSGGTSLGRAGARFVGRKRFVLTAVRVHFQDIGRPPPLWCPIPPNGWTDHHKDSLVIPQVPTIVLHQGNSTGGFPMKFSKNRNHSVHWYAYCASTGASL